MLLVALSPTESRSLGIRLPLPPCEASSASTSRDTPRVGNPSKEPAGEVRTGEVGGDVWTLLVERSYMLGHPFVLGQPHPYDRLYRGLQDKVLHAQNAGQPSLPIATFFSRHTTGPHDRPVVLANDLLLPRILQDGEEIHSSHSRSCGLWAKFPQMHPLNKKLCPCVPNAFFGFNNVKTKFLKLYQ